MAGPLAGVAHEAVHVQPVQGLDDALVHRRQRGAQSLRPISQVRVAKVAGIGDSRALQYSSSVDALRLVVVNPMVPLHSGFTYPFKPHHWQHSSRFIALLG